MTNRKTQIYLIAMITLILLFLACFMLCPNGNQKKIFFDETSNYMADYVNVAKYAAARDPYCYGQEDSLAAEHAYPPLAYLIFYIRARFADYVNLSAFEAGATSMGKMTSTYAVYLEMFCLILLLYEALKKKAEQKYLLVGTLIFSSIFLFSVERGNVIGLAACCTTFFVLYYNSTSRLMRELALLALAVAAALKVYPALLGLLLLFEKEYKEAIRCIIYGVLLFFLPFLFFKGGLNNIGTLLGNLKMNSACYAAKVFPRFNFRYWTTRLTDENLRSILSLIFGIVDYIICIGAVFLSYFQPTRWKKYMLILLAIVVLPINSAEYTGLYLLVGIVLFLNEAAEKKMDGVYLLLMILLLNPFQIVIDDFNVTCAAMNVSVSAMLLLLCMETLWGIRLKKLAGRRTVVI